MKSCRRTRKAANGRGRPAKAAGESLVGLQKAKMKNSKDQKVSNGVRHHFQTFSEQMGQLKVAKVSLSHRALDLDPDDLTQSFFGIALADWRELNLSQAFVGLLKEVTPLAQSLGHVVHNKEKIVNALDRAGVIDKEVNASNLHLEPLLALWNGLVLDLQGGALPYWPKFLRIVIASMALKEPAVIKRGFESLIEVTKILQRQHPTETLNFLQSACQEVISYPEISEQSLALIAEALSRFIRRSKDKASLVRYLAKQTPTDPKGAKTLEFIIEVIICALKLNALAKDQSANVDERLFKVLLAECWGEDGLHPGTQFWPVLFATMKDTFGASESCAKATVDLLQERGDTSIDLTLLFTEFVLEMCSVANSSCKQGSPIPEFCFDWLNSMIAQLSSWEKHHKSLEKILHMLFVPLAGANAHTKDRVGALIDLVLMDLTFTLEEKSDLICSLQEGWSFDTSDSVCFPRLLSFWQRSFSLDSLSTVCRCLRRICEKNIEEKGSLFSRKSSNSLHWQNAYVLELQLISTKNTLPTRMAKCLSENISSLGQESVEDLLVCLVHIRPVELDAFLEACEAVQKQILAGLDDGNEAILSWLLPLSRAMSMLICPRDIFKYLNKQLWTGKLASRASSNKHVFEALILMATLDTSGKSMLRMIPDLRSTFMLGLTSTAEDVRTLAVTALNAMVDEDECKCFQVMAEANETKASTATYRDVLRLMTKIKVSGDDFFDEAILRYFIGSLFVNFSLLWKPVIELTEGIVANLPEELFWRVIEAVYMDTQEEFHRKQILALLEAVNLSNEVKCRFLTNHFLNVVLKEDEGKQMRLISAYLKVFGKFPNIRSAKRFEELLSVAYRQLCQAEAARQESGIDFVCRAFREAMQQKELCKEIADKHKWKDNLRELAEGFLEKGLGKKVEGILQALIVGHLKKTIRDKQQRQQQSRQFIVEKCAQMGEAFLEGVLTLLVLDSAPKVASLPLEEIPKQHFSQHENYEMSLDVFIVALPSIVRSKEWLMDCIVDLMSLLSAQYQEKGGNNSKTRSKTLAMLARVFSNTAKHLVFAEKHEEQIIAQCLLPALSRDSNENSSQVSPKVLSILETWLKTDKFLRLFFVEAESSDGEGKSSVLSKLSALLQASYLDKAFTSSLVDKVCHLIDLVHNVLPEQKRNKELYNTQIVHSALHKRLAAWMNEKHPVNKAILFDERMAAITYIMQRSAGDFSEEEEKANIEALSRLPSPQMDESLLSRWFDAFHAALEGRSSIPDKAFNLLTTVKDHVFLPKVACLLIRFTNLSVSRPEHALDPFTLVDSYKHEPKTFLYLLNCCFGQLHGSDLGQITPSVNAMLWLMEKLSKERPDEFVFLCQQHLLKPLQRGLRSKDENVYNAYVSMLQFIIRTGKLECLEQIARLCNVEEEESDFLENMKHLQVHRRARALRNLSKGVSSGAVRLSRTVISKYIQPLVSRCFFNSEFRTSSDLISSCISTLGVICTTSSLPSYVKLLEHYIRIDVGEDKAFAKQKFQIIAQILSSYDAQSSTAVAADAEDEEKADDAEEADVAMDMEQEPQEENSPSKPQLRLKSLVTKLVQLLKSDQSDANLHVFVALTKLTNMFPTLFKNLVQSLIIEMSNKLRSRDFDFRQACRKTLCEIMQILGPSYLCFLLSTLETALQRGYQVHICIYTISFVLHSILDALTPDAVAAILPKAIEYVIKELFSDFSREKQVREIVKKTPEAAKISSYSLLEMLSSHCSKQSLITLVTPFVSPKIGNLTHEKAQKCKQSLHSVMRGLIENRHIQYQDLLTFAYGVLKGKFGDQSAEMRSSVVMLRKQFALNLMLTVAKRAPSAPSLGEVKHLLQEVVECLESKNTDLVLLCLKLITILIQQKEVATFLNEEHLSQKLFQFLHKNLRRYFAMKDKQLFSQSCVILNRLLKTDTVLNNAKETLKALKVFFLTCLEQDSSHSPKVLLSILKHVPVDESEEVILQLCKSFVECGEENASQGICALLRHQNRNQQRFVCKFMLENISYEAGIGRRRITAYIRELTERDSQMGNIVSKEVASELFFVVAQRLMAEELPEIQENLEKIIKALISRQFAKKDVKLTDSITNWLAGAEKADRIPYVVMAVRLSSVIVTISAPEAKKFSLKVLEQLKAILLCNTKALPILENKIAEIMLQVYMVSMIRQILTHSDRVAKTIVAEHQEVFVSLLLHPNTQLRNESLALYTDLLGLIREDPKQWASVLAKEQLLKVEANLFEILRFSPSTSLDELKKPLFTLACFHADAGSFGKYVKKLLSAFYNEKKNEPNSFIRRIPIVALFKQLVAEGKSFFANEDTIDPLLRLCLKHETSEHLAEDIADILKALRDRLGMEAYSRMAKKVTSLKATLSAGEKRKLLHGKDQKAKVRRKK